MRVTQFHLQLRQDEWMTEVLSQEALDYLEKNFDYSYCPSTRKLP
jgi:hypothetical protein